MKQHFLQYTLLLFIVSFAYANEMQIKEFSKKELKNQNIQIASLAAQAMSKNLPTKINKFTTLLSVESNASTLIYIFAINNTQKSDAVIQKEDHSKMQKNIIAGVCQSAQRFLQAGIDTKYIYLSARTKKLLFQFYITQKKCTKQSSK